MKATELMIGDWVESSFFGKTRITSLREYEGYGWVMTSNSEDWKSDISLSPIPLTPEILEKNGFNEIGEGFELPSKYLAKSRFFIFNNKKALCIMVGGDWVSLHYVHQLQQILRLCGLNDLADNFQI